MAFVVLATAAPPSAHASRYLKLGINDDARVLSPAQSVVDDAFVQLGVLKPGILRVHISWKEVATARPANPRNSESEGYNEGAWMRLDHAVTEAKSKGIRVLFTILHTPRWANGGRAPNYAPRDMRDLAKFAYAAAERYSGTFIPAHGDVELPRVAHWTAWNEPNLSYWLRPLARRNGLAWATYAGRVYAKMCNAVMRGVHAAQPVSNVKVACGVTSPRKLSGTTSARPLDFLRAIKAAGARFDVYAHHPHPANYRLSPSTKPRPGVIGIGNIGVLVNELTRLYGNKRLWLTEYGYQTNPPDGAGVSPRGQARFLDEAYAIVRRKGRIDMLVWFLLRDERTDPISSPLWLSGWHGGLMYDETFRGGVPKPAFWKFKCLAARRSAALC